MLELFKSYIEISPGFCLQISPPIVKQGGQFVISVKNNKKLDAEKVKKLEFKIVATETGPSHLTTSADVLVSVLDVNDNAPLFSQPEYRWRR